MLSGPLRIEEDNLLDPEDTLVRFRQCLMAGKEAQATITNYRKEGDHFINLLTVIPIKWDPSEEQPRYIVGFQANRQNCVFVP